MTACPAGVRAALAGGLCWAGVAAAQEASVGDLAARPGITVPWPDAPSSGTAPAAAETPAGEARYTLTVTGLDALRLATRFRDGSALWKGRHEVANLAQVNRRAAEDSDLVDRLLRSLGHYGGRTTVTTAALGGGGIAVTLAVDSGPLYRFAAVTPTVPPGGPAKLVAAGLAIRPGDPVAAASITAAEDGLKAYLGVRGYPFARVDEPVIVVDHATRTAELTQAVDPGPFGRFGRIRVVGRSLLTAGQVTRLARFKPGDAYSASDLDDLRRALIATGLLGGVTLTPVRAASSANGGAVIDIDVATDAAPLRTIAATAGYSTSQGFRIETSWEHRNLLPPNGAVTFRGVAAEREQLLGAELRRRNWRARDVTLDLNATLSNSTQDAFKARTLAFGAAIERETNIIWQKQWYFSLGVEGLLTRQTDKGEVGDPVATYYIAAAPASLTYDGSDNLLDPTRGFRLTGRASPELSFQSGVFAYVKLQAEASGYLPVSRRVTLAVRGHLGAIAGASRRNIAPTRRFYAGGGGSVRGFGYQNVGPQDADGDPRGGNSVAEASFEARFRFGDFGLVPFVDVGQVYNSTVPQFDRLKLGAGLGGRYYTSFGPVRIDLATPVNPGPRDARLQFYVSIGQAF